MLIGSEQAKNSVTPPEMDLTNCDREPIRIPGCIQAHGVLLVLNADDLTVVQASQNLQDLIGRSANEALGSALDAVLGTEFVQRFSVAIKQSPDRVRPEFLGMTTIPGASPELSFQVISHRTEGGILLELELSDAESTTDIHPLIDALTMRSESAKTLAELSQLTAEEIRQFTGFDRVLIYRFDADWHGIVVGEDGNGRLPSLLEHRFPASDIPAQARELYRLNRVRIIPDASYQPVPVTPGINPKLAQPLDMTFSTLRSVSPVHLEYMRNMETASSMSISILRDGQLWGLISCHHCEPRKVPYADRLTCDLIARVFSLRLAALEHTADFERRIEVRSTYGNLLKVMADQGDFATALVQNAEMLLGFVSAQGAAVFSAGNCTLIGQTPDESQVRAIAQWLFEDLQQEVYSTDCLSAVYPAAAEYAAKVSGLLAVGVSKLHPSYVLWFRPEVIQTLKWGGDPHKAIEQIGDQTKIHPRRSFQTWRETVRNKSIAWEHSEIEGAAELRNAIVDTVLIKAEELAELNAELTRSNKELEAFSYSVSHDLRAPLRHIVGYAEILKDSAGNKLTPKDERCIATIIESSEYAGRLVDKLLGYSRLGRSELQLAQLDMNVLIRETISDVMRDAEGRQVTWRVGQFATVSADLMMLRMALRDLLSNAVKYTRQRDVAIIEIESHETATEHVFSVKDNGVGFDMQFADKLFGVFQRLHKWEEYEGTGIGLANVRRVMERHGGQAWGEGKEGEGAIFYFSLPKTA